MRVCTLGGDIRDIDGELYKCRIRDLDGNVHEFTAYGLDEVTGSLGRPLSLQQIQKLFPHIKSEKEKRMLMGSQKVDYLIGLSNASWQPEKVTRARGCQEGEGDFWIWENMFGRCVGGSHPLLQGGVTRSESLFTVLNVLHANKAVEESMMIPACQPTSLSCAGRSLMTAALSTRQRPSRLAG